MFNFLIIEDDGQVLEDTEGLLKENFPGSKVDVADAIGKGMELIDGAIQKRRYYNAAILDFKLPKDIGLEAHLDETLCEKFRREMTATLIIHFTAYSEDPRIKKHMGEYHKDEIDTNAELINKLTSDWPTKLTEKLKERLYTKKVKDKLDRFFGDPKKPPPGGSYLYSNRGGAFEITHGSITHELSDLSIDIIEYWEHLDSRLKDRIKTIFNIDEKSTPIGISMG